MTYTFSIKSQQVRTILIKLITAFSLSLYATVTFANYWYRNINLGLGASRIGQSQTLTLFTTSDPFITDNYSASTRTSFTGLIGLGGGYRFDLAKQWQLSLGAEGDYVTYSSVKGTVHPLVNVAPDFDTLDYRFNLESYLLVLQPTLFFLTGNAWYPYVKAGVGAAWNHLSDFTESTPAGSTTAPSVYQFQDNTNVSFAYTLGAGVEYVLNQKQHLQIGYQYLNMGNNAEFNTITNQTTAQRFQSGPISAHVVLVSLLFG